MLKFTKSVFPGEFTYIDSVYNVVNVNGFLGKVVFYKNGDKTFEPDEDVRAISLWVMKQIVDFCEENRP